MAVCVSVCLSGKRTIEDRTLLPDHCLCPVCSATQRMSGRERREVDCCSSIRSFPCAPFLIPVRRVLSMQILNAFHKSISQKGEKKKSRLAT